MGLRQAYLSFFEECFAQSIGDLRGKRMLEFGNQYVHENASVPERTGKEYFTHRGVAHVSLDLNGQDGALRIDFSKPIQRPEWYGTFDIITNAGTLEHVEPFRAQYECFRNIHRLLKVGGIVIHLLPDIHELETQGLWKGHCNNYYSHEFVRRLAAANHYRIVAMTIINGMTCACLQKERDVPFMEDRKEFLASIIRKRGGIIYPGINDRGLYRPYGLARLFYQSVLDVTRPLRHRLGLRKRVPAAASPAPSVPEHPATRPS